MNIGLSQRTLIHKNKAYDSLEHDWYRYLKDHTLFSVQNTLNQDFKQLADKLDGLILTGGDDSPIRRTVELKLAAIMMQQMKPVLGICHGAFLMTDILGGDFSRDDNHLDTKHPVYYYGEEYIVNSYHSNIIHKLHDGATVLATDANGNCEAWIDDNIAGVLWHPQRMKDPWLPSEILNKFHI